MPCLTLSKPSQHVGAVEIYKSATEIYISWICDFFAIVRHQFATRNGWCANWASWLPGCVALNPRKRILILGYILMPCLTLSKPSQHVGAVEIYKSATEIYISWICDFFAIVRHQFATRNGWCANWASWLPGCVEFVSRGTGHPAIKNFSIIYFAYISSLFTTLIPFVVKTSTAFSWSSTLKTIKGISFFRITKE